MCANLICTVTNLCASATCSTNSRTTSRAKPPRASSRALITSSPRFRASPSRNSRTPIPRSLRKCRVPMRFARHNSFLQASTGQISQAAQTQKWFTQLAGLGQVHIEFGHPIVEIVRVHQHLLHAPGFLVVGRNDVGVTGIARIGIETDTFVLGVVIVQRLLQSRRSPRLAVGPVPMMRAVANLTGPK